MVPPHFVTEIFMTRSGHSSFGKQVLLLEIQGQKIGYSELLYMLIKFKRGSLFTLTRRR